ncbi:MAG TPA: hypothetical protein VM389_11015 [Phycisphaerae bacterium]|nr:hypothetical protein [Phycisphaerae bacterium]
MDTVKLGGLEVSRFILGSNPFSGFAHQTPEASRAMVRYYTVARIKEALQEAEAAGITTLIARADTHVIRLLAEYWDEGGKLQWVAQTCPGVGPSDRVARMAIEGGARAAFIHGGVMDHCFAQGDFADPLAGIEVIRQASLPVGIAAHNPDVLRWAEANLDVDFYMCSYYNAAHRDKSAEKLSGQPEWFHDADRKAMIETIQGLSKPAIHYKVMAAGRNGPADALRVAAAALRNTDAVCVGVFTKDHHDMIAEDVRLFQSARSAHSLQSRNG